MNQHYLDHMFAGESSAFLEQVVDIDEETAVHREEAAGVQGSKDRLAADQRSGTFRVKGDATPAGSSVVGVVRGETPGSRGGLGPDNASDCRRSMQAQRGKTVKDLSRLWRYKDGNEPKD